MVRRRRQSSDEFSREIDAHLDLEAERLASEGMDPRAARLAARRAFGSPLAARERFYEAGRMVWADHLLHDLRHGIRGLLRYPISCAVAIVSLAAGIGATTAALTIRDVVFHRPPALYRTPEQLSSVQVSLRNRPIRFSGSLVPKPLFDIWSRGGAGGVFAAAAPEQVREVRRGERREGVRIRQVTPNFFATVGVDPIIGQTFADATAERGQKPAVLSYRVWQIFFQGRADIVGTAFWIGAEPYSVVGVMPQRFWFSMMDSPIWTPLLDEPSTADAAVETLVRRDAGVTPAQLAERLQPGLAEYSAGLPASDRALQLKVSALEGTPMGNAMVVALPYALGMAVLLTLLIACANVAILAIAQWTAREHEIAIRASLGASRGRIVRALVVESMLIALAGGLLGIGAAFSIQGLMLRRGGPNLAFFDLTLDPRIFVQALIVTLLTGLAAGVGPALLETRRLQDNPMRTIATSDRTRQRWRHALVLLEIAVTVALLVVAGGMLDTYRRNYRIDVGYPTRPLVLLRVENGNGVRTSTVTDALKQVPGVIDAAASTSVPFIAAGPMRRVSTGRESEPVRAEQASIAPQFFATLDVPMRKGRAFTRQDSPETRTAILNEMLATRLFGGADPVGRELWIDQRPYEIVGVVADYKNQALQNPDRDPKVFLPFALEPAPKQVTFLIRASSDAVGVVERAIRRDLPAAVAGHVVAAAMTVDQIISVAGQEILVGTAPLFPLIATGMLLTAAGIYGVLAFSITRRSRELAVRIAIGATHRHIVELIASHSLRLVVIGSAVGVAGTFALSRIVRANGDAGSFLDPSWASFLVPVGIIAGVGLVATFVPSRRAARIDPATLLRTT